MKDQQQPENVVGMGQRPPETIDPSRVKNMPRSQEEEIAAMRRDHPALRVYAHHNFLQAILAAGQVRQNVCVQIDQAVQTLIHPATQNGQLSNQRSKAESDLKRLRRDLEFHTGDLARLAQAFRDFAEAEGLLE